MIAWLDASLVRLLGTVVTSLFLGAFLVGPVALLMRAIPGTNGATRHAVWWAVLAVMILAPWTVAPGPVGPVGSLGEPERVGVARLAEPPARSERAIEVPEVGPLRFQLSGAALRSVGLVWIVGVLVLVTGIGRGLRRVRRLKATAVPLPGDREQAVLRLTGWATCRRPVSVGVSPSLRSPVAVGYLHPAILLPEAMAEELDDEDLALVIGHELAHLVRRDDWTDLLQRLVGALLFFHPPAWWVRREIRLEMEKACDHWAVSRTGCTGERYAQCLVRVAERALGGCRLPLPGATSRLRQRVATLLGQALPHRATVSPGPALFLGAVLAFLTAAATWLPVPALTVDRDAPPVVDVADPEVARLVAELSLAEPARRAEAAYALGQLGDRAASASPHLAELLGDRAELPRRRGRTSQVWGRPDERREVTSVGEEALKALLFLGPEASLEPLSRAVADEGWPEEHLASWGLRLLREFD